MKRILSLILVLLFVTSAFPLLTGGAVADGKHGFLPGDANDDEDVSMKDVLLIRRYIAGLQDEKDIDIIAADVVTDEDVNTKDVLLIRRYIAGLEELDGNNEDGKYKVGSLKIGGKNISRYSILIPDDADECMAYSAEKLSEYIGRTCGIRPNVTTDETLDSYFIEYKKDAEDVYSLGDEGYNVTLGEDGNVTLTCGRLRGSLYSTYYLLERFGWRFLNDDIEYLYKADTVDLPEGFSETEIPAFVYRGLNQIGSTGNDFAALRLNGVDSEGSYSAANLKYGGGVGNLHAHGHSYAYQMAGIEYAYNNKAIAEMGLFDEQPCLTSEETYEKFKAFNFAIYDMWVKNGTRIPGIHFTMISCSPNDNTAFCKCANCKAVYTEEGSISGTVIRMSNRIAEAQREYMPGIGVYTIAYWDARNAPRHTRPDDDVCVCFCVGGCNNHTFDHVEECVAAGGNPRYPFMVWDIATQSPRRADFNVSNEYDLDCYNRWCELTDNIWVWYYACNFSYQIAPCPNVLNIYNDYKYLASTGTTGVYTEGSSAGITFELLRGYLAAKMMWDPFMSEEEFEGHLDEFLMIYFGDGWQYIKQYVYMQDECGNLQGCFMNNFDRPWNFYNKAYYAEHFEEMLKLFEDAYSAADDEDQRERVMLASIHVVFLGLSATYESNYVNGTEVQKNKYKARYETLWDLINTEGYLKDVNENGIRCADVGQSGRGGLGNFPANSSDVRDTMSWIMDDFDGSW